jgi:predicted PurR-regulated permease PerM
MEKGIAKWVALLAIVFIAWLARDVLPPFIIGGILAYIFSPLADQIASRTRLPRTAAALLVFFAILGGLIAVSGLIGYRLNREIRDLRQQGPDIVETLVVQATGGEDLILFGRQFSPGDLAERAREAVGSEVSDPREALHYARVTFELALNVIMVLLSFAYFMLDGRTLGAFLIRFVPYDQRPHVRHLAAEIHVALGRYLRGHLILIAVMIVATFLLLEFVFHLPYALPIAIVTGFLEVIPLLGPIAAGVIAGAVAFTQGGINQALIMGVSYWLMRQIQDQFLMPYVVGRAVHVHPLMTIFAVLVGERTAGVLGMFLAVPIAAAIKVIIDYTHPELLADSPIEVVRSKLAPGPDPH